MIDTPEQYEQLINSDIGSRYSRIIIMEKAHPTILLLPKQFWNASYKSVEFIDGRDNEALIQPSIKDVSGTFQNGDNLTLGLPDNYESYRLLVQGPVSELSTADFEYIVQWKHMKELTIFDYYSFVSDGAYGLSQHIDKLAKCKHLRKLFLVLKPVSYDKLQVKVFLKQLKALETIQFLTTELESGDIEKFIRRQKIPKNWTFKVYDAENLIEYKKVRRNGLFR